MVADGRVWIDSNKIAFSQLSVYYSNVLGPAIATTQWTYTVPVGRFAIIEYILCKITRFTAAGAVGTSVASVRLTPSTTPMVPFEAMINSNGVGDKDNSSCIPHLLMTAGDTLQGVTFDNSAGGSCIYEIGMVGREYIL